MGANHSAGHFETPDGSGCNVYSYSLGLGQNGCPSGYGRGGAQWKWCADFAKWVWRQAGANVSGLNSSSQSFYNYGMNHGTWHAAGTYVPVPGDAVVYTSGGTYRHVGIVVSSGKHIPDVVQGNWSLNGSTGWAVRYDANSSGALNYSHFTIKGYASPSGGSTTPPAYHMGKQVKVDSHATGGLSGHTGPSNSYSAGPTRTVNSPLHITCYVSGQSIKGPYGTESIWDLADDGYFYSDAWVYTGTNGAAIPKCAPKAVKVDSHATGGLSGHRGPSNSYAHGSARAANSGMTIWCYVTGDSIKGPYGTENIWDFTTDGYYYSDAWVYTGTNGAAVPHC
ncbi:hypothetical protein GCM10027076_16010 [Nocardioides montaniterrae]